MALGMDLVGQRGPADLAALGTRVAANVSSAVRVPPEAVRSMLIALLAGGHVLIEDYPGVGKTALARALAASIDADCTRVQCTADMLPADLVGANVYVQRDGRFEFRPGPVFSNIVLVDEINRASPKTQSGLLECMQERRVTVDGVTHELARPFVVIATQNPIEFDGTYSLPQAQLDRFMVRVSLGYPSALDEAAMLAEHAGGDRVLDLVPVSTVAEIVAAQDAVAGIHAGEPLRNYVVALAAATRRDPRTQLGASPRAALMLLQAATVHAALSARDHVLPDDVQALAHVVLSHRLLLAPGLAETARREIVDDALAEVPAL
jgi:MoxR-like ATPase